MSPGPWTTFQWFKDGTAIPGETTDTYNATQPGLYTVEVYEGACTDSGSIRVFESPDINIPTPQTVCASEAATFTLGDLNVDNYPGDFYDAPTGGNLISSDQIISETTYYYQVEVPNGQECYPTDRQPVEVVIDSITPACDPCNVASGNVDTDGDGITDVCDDDDDNDGILDIEESDFSRDFTTSWVVDPSNSNKLISILSSGVTITATLNAIASDITTFTNGNLSSNPHWNGSPYAGVNALNLNLKLTSSPKTLTLEFRDAAGNLFVPQGLEFYWDFLGGVGGGSSYSLKCTLNNGVLMTPTNPSYLNDVTFNNNSISNDLSTTSDNTSGAGSFRVINPSSTISFGLTGVFSNPSITSSNLNDGMRLGISFIDVNGDTDNDGVLNYLDIDSDNDGCNDVVESGGVDANDDGELDGTGFTSSGRVDGGSGGYDGVNGNEYSPIGYTSDSAITGSRDLFLGERIIISSTAQAIETDVWSNTSPFNPDYSASSATNVTSDLVYSWTFDDGSGPVAVTPTVSGTNGETFDFGVVEAATAGTYAATITHPNNLCVTQSVSFTVNALDPCTHGATIGTPTANDPDGDGINNQCDEDDDNDGILDVNEGCTDSNVGGDNRFPAANGNPTMLMYSGTVPFEDDNNFSLTRVVNVPSVSNITPGSGLVLNHLSGANSYQLNDVTATNLNESIANQEFIEFNFTTNNTFDSAHVDWVGFFNRISTNPGFSCTFSISDDNTNFSNLSSFVVGASEGASSSNPAPNGFRSNKAQYIPLDNTTTYKVRIHFYAPTALPFEFDDIFIQFDQCRVDTDNDGIPNQLDLDSDNDGCNDVVESGGVDANDDGVLDGTGFTSSGRVDGGSGGYNGISAIASEVTPLGFVEDTNITGSFTVVPGDRFTISSLATATQTDVWDNNSPFDPDYTASSAVNVTSQLNYVWTFDNGSGAVAINPSRSGADLANFDFGVIGSSLTGTYSAVITHPNNPCVFQTVSFVLSTSDPCSDGAIIGTPTANDPDGDGINNECDEDDDNDGILDVNECEDTSVLDWSFNRWAPGSMSNTYTVDGTTLSFTVTDANNALVTNPADTPLTAPFYQGDQGFVTTSLVSAVDLPTLGATGVVEYDVDLGAQALSNVSFKLFDVDGEVNSIRRRERFVIVGYNGTNTVNPILTANGTQIINGNTVEGVDPTPVSGSAAANGVVSVIFSAPIDSFKIIFDVTNDSVINSGSEPGFGLFDISFSTCDTDGDGIPNITDIDSDNDDCNDVVESGGVDTNNDGALDGTGFTSSGRVDGGSGGYNGITASQREFKPIEYTGDTSISGLYNLNFGDTFTISSDAIATQAQEWFTTSPFAPNYDASSAIDVTGDLIYTWTFDNGSGAVGINPTVSGSNGQTFSFNNLSANDSGVYTVVISHPHNPCIFETRSFTIVVEEADIVTTKTNGSATYTPGTSVTYTITVTNNGPSDASSVEVEDTAPAGTTISSWSATATGAATFTASGTGDLDETITDMANGAVVTYTVVVDVPSDFTGDLSNTVVVTNPTDPDTSCPDCTDGPDTRVEEADIVTTKTNGSATYTPGTSVTYTITVTNNGPSDASSVEVEDTAPAGTTISSWSATATGAATFTASGTGDLDETITDMANGAVVTYTVVVDVPSDFTGDLSNTVVVTNPTDPDTSCPDCTDGPDTMVGVADLITVKTLESANNLPNVGDIVTFMISVTNNGPSLATNVSLTDQIPVGLTPTVRNGLVSQGSYDAVSGLWNIGTLTVGVTATLIIEGVVDLAASGTVIINTTTAGATTDQSDPTTVGDVLTVSVPSAGDSDGDGVTDTDESNSGTDPNDPCDYNISDITLPITANTDCDGDGITDADEIASGTDPNDPCSGNASDVTVIATDGGDCDGDGVSNADEINGPDGQVGGGDGTDPNDPCDYNVSQVTLPVSSTVDCDGDGITDVDEIASGTDPNDPCSGNASDVTVIATDGGDCDGDGVSNADEINGPDGQVGGGDGTDPNDPCDYNVSQVTLPVSSTVDCDGDGVTDADEIASGTDPNDPCSFNIADVTVTQDPAWLALDCDGDGVTNGDELADGTNPLDICDYLTTSQTVTPSAEWEGLDCDGDGVSNGQEVIDGTDTQDPCDYDANSQDLTLADAAWDALDCDGDGVSNIDELFPPNGGEPTNPKDPCDLNVEDQNLQPTQAWLEGDCDEDNVDNGTEIGAGDTDGDGIPDYLDTDDDGDGVDTIHEDYDGDDDPTNQDSDGDGIPDYLDTDDDGDTIPTIDEGPNPDGDGDPNTGDTRDSDGDGVWDYLDVDPRRIRVWNTVSPDGDGRNDFFYLENIEDFENTVSIFNRWGVEVYGTDNYNNTDRRFEGFSNGRATVMSENRLASGTYFYVINYIDELGSTQRIAGYLFIH